MAGEASRPETGDLQDLWRRRESNPRTGPNGPPACDATTAKGAPCTHPASPFLPWLNLCWRHQRQLADELFERMIAELHKDSGWVYFGVRSDRPGEVKIGFTTSLSKRLQNLGLDPVITVPYATRREEQRLHRQFADQRTTGEWFRIEGPLLSYIEEQVQIQERQHV